MEKPALIPRIVIAVNVAVSLVATAIPAVASDPGPGWHDRVPVTAATRLDWVFALSNQSPAKAPAEWVKGYESTAGAYQLFVPRARGGAGRKPRPLILFISPGNNPAGRKAFELVCRQQGVLFASPHAAGNRCPFPRRVRIVLDVLDDIRRRFPIDADRTYLAGFSGGGRVACTIGFALPEYFGGVVSVCAAGDLRTESWLRRRATDRLSVALVTGESDFNRGEVERFRGPMLADVGVRARVWVQPGSGHSIPAAVMPAVFEWLEADRPRRRRLASRYPASRLGPGKPPGRAEWAAALLDEAQRRLKSPGTLYSGLSQLKGIRVRWNDLPAAGKALVILAEFDARTERPWEKQDIAEQRRFLIARARGLDRYATGPLPPQYVRQRPDMLKAALALWKQVLDDGQDSKAVVEARRRIPLLRKRLAEPGSDDDG